ncbi:MAG: MBL fold metallo-hydrolase [Chloroflexi bacterium]|nr:MBL fold metallo-hydrolase [Chloroflexota bacterium]
MEIKVLGAHNLESATTKMVSILVDDVLALDSGGLASSLSLPQMEKVTSLLITHCHFDHVKDLANLALHRAFNSTTLNLYATPDTIRSISTHILNGTTYPKFNEIPTPERPAIRYHPLEPFQAMVIDGYTVLAVPAKHPTTAVSYQVTSKEGKSFLYSGDTGPGCVAGWVGISPQVLLMDTTFPDSFTDFAIQMGHMTPGLLKKELGEFSRLKKYLPEIVLIHLMPQYEGQIREEVAQVARELEARIVLAYEGMQICL